MIQVTDFSAYQPANGARTAVTIGNFDGCHLGHQELIEATKNYGQRFAATSTAITFSPRPEAFFRSMASEALLFTEDQKTRGLGELGIEQQLVQRFDLAFSRVTHHEFYRRYLREQLAAAALVVGDNFHFGHKRMGDASFLRQCTAADGLALTIGDAVQFRGQSISSTRIRTVLREDGDVVTAAVMLGRPYVLEGIVEQGDQLGRRLDFPTANLGEVKQLLPKYGVYAGYVWLEASLGSAERPAITTRPANVQPAVFNIGVRPTLARPDSAARIEAHLLTGEFGPDALYGLHAGYYLAHRLRGEQAFADLTALRRQISMDCEQARQLLGVST